MFSRVKHGLQGQAKPAHVARVDLAEAEIDRIAGSDVALCGRNGAGGVGLPRRLCAAIHVAREGPSVAFGPHDCSDGLRRDIWRPTSEEQTSELQSQMRRS